MRLLLAVLSFFVFAVVSIAPPEAARDASVDSARSLEVLVFESRHDPYSRHFRTHVVPAYQRTPHAADAPMRFIDVERGSWDELPLDGPVTMVPTAVLLKDGREVGRIPGYTGPEAFMTMISRLIARAN